MAYTRNVPEGKFVAWGKKKAKENSHIVKEGSTLEGTIVEVKDSDKYFKVFELSVEGVDENVIIPATKRIRDETGYAANKEGNNWKPLPLDKQKAQSQVKVGDKLRFHFEGMKKTTTGNDLYDIWVEVDAA